MYATSIITRQAERHFIETNAKTSEDAVLSLMAYINVHAIQPDQMLEVWQNGREGKKLTLDLVSRGRVTTLVQALLIRSATEHESDYRNIDGDHIADEIDRAIAAQKEGIDVLCHICPN